MRLDRIGVPFRGEPFLVTAEATVAYARAINDDNRAHLSGELAPPLFAVVPALRSMILAKREIYEGFTLHGQHDLRIHRPIAPGMTLWVEAEPVGVASTKAGAAIVTHCTTRDGDGGIFNEQTMVSLAHGIPAEGSAGLAAPDHRMPEGLRETAPIAEFTYPVDSDQTLRYGEASGDPAAYTFDAAEARARGLPGPIVHGLCTMAMVSRAVVSGLCGGDSRRLARLAVRFSGLLLMQPAQSVRTRLWSMGIAGDRAVAACEAYGSDGSVVIRHGRAEVAPEGFGG